MTFGWMVLALLSQLTLLQENFEGGTLPGGWSVGNGGGPATWFVDASTNYFVLPPNAGNYVMALLTSDTTSAYDDSLLFPVLGNDLNYTSHTLTLDYAYFGAQPTDTLQLLLRSHVAGVWGPWVVLDNQPFSGISGTYTLPFQPTPGSDSFQLMLRFAADTGRGFYVLVDNATVTVQSGAVLDAATEAILSPASGYQAPPVPVQVVIRNLSSSSASIPVHVWIQDTATGQTVYDHTLTRTVGAGARDTVAFPDFTPTLPGVFRLTAAVLLVGDQDPSNDSLSVSFSTLPQFGAIVESWPLPDTFFLELTQEGTAPRFFVLHGDTSYDIQRFDLLTGQTTPLFSLAYTPGQPVPWGLAYDAATQTLWLTRVDPVGGSAQLEVYDLQGNLQKSADLPPGQFLPVLDDAPGAWHVVGVLDTSLTSNDPVQVVDVDFSGASPVLTPILTGDAIAVLPTAFGMLPTMGWVLLGDLYNATGLVLDWADAVDSLRVDTTDFAPQEVFGVDFLESPGITLDSMAYALVNLNGGTLARVALGVDWQTVPTVERPNPVRRRQPVVRGGRGALHFLTPLPRGTHVQILNALGRRIFTLSAPVPSRLPLHRGFYWVRLDFPDGTHRTWKTIVF